MSDEAPIPEAAKRYAIALGALGLLFTIIGFIGAIPAIISANAAAAQPEGPSSALIEGPDYTLAFVLIGIGVVGVIMLIAGLAVRAGQRRQGRSESGS